MDRNIIIKSAVYTFALGIYIQVVQHLSFKEGFEKGWVNGRENGLTEAKTLFLKHCDMVDKVINKSAKSE